MSEDNENPYRGWFEWFMDENASSYLKRISCRKNIKHFEAVIIQEAELKQMKKIKQDIVDLLKVEYCTIQSIETACKQSIRYFNKETAQIERHYEKLVDNDINVLHNDLLIFSQTLDHKSTNIGLINFLTKIEVDIAITRNRIKNLSKLIEYAHDEQIEENMDRYYY